MTSGKLLLGIILNLKIRWTKKLLSNMRIFSADMTVSAVDWYAFRKSLKDIRTYGNN